MGRTNKTPLTALLLVLCLLLCNVALAQSPVKTGAERMEQYLPLLKGRKVALLINQTSRVGNRLLVDTLLKRGVQVVKIFVPEHGFRGTADAGAHIANTKDASTGLPVISLYGNKKPTSVQLADVDVVVYDLQDVGVRFYTYISTLQYAMEACAENGKTILVLDRPNPNDYVDGPVLEKSQKSFVGMQAIPVAYGMTAAEYAKMLVGEKWFAGAEKTKLEVVKCDGWKHGQAYDLPVSPSPNLKTFNAIRHYPSLCFFEGTVISVGRGTGKPFEQWGNPKLKTQVPDSFKPAKTVGATDPMYNGQWCYGYDLTRKAYRRSMDPTNLYAPQSKVDLQWLMMAYKSYPEKQNFFNSFFEKLTGTEALRKQIQSGVSEANIRASWQPELVAFKTIRAKYLLYK